MGLSKTDIGLEGDGLICEGIVVHKYRLGRGEGGRDM